MIGALLQLPLVLLFQVVCFLSLALDQFKQTSSASFVLVAEVRVLLLLVLESDLLVLVVEGLLLRDDLSHMIAFAVDVVLVVLKMQHNLL